MIRASTFSGYYIWNQINTIKGDMNELDKAMCEVERDSLAYNLLKKEYEKRKSMWDEMQKTKYTISEE